MCGITGWFDRERDLTQELATLRAMSQTLSRRGPDADGTFVSPKVALAHRRLRIIDPEGGAQPMRYAMGDHTLVITYNGEIYNFRELRSELSARGHTFTTRSDTEVILHAYAEWGDACVERLNGIFAFALWDPGKARLLLARDRLGVKPLFYAERGSAVLFGSELKALLANPLVAPEVNAESLSHFFAGIPVNDGVYRDVHEVPAGHIAVFDGRGGRVEAYWRLTSREHRDSLEDTVEQVRALLDAAVTRQLVSDVPVGLLVSGGIDSSGIAALATHARRRAGEPLLDAFTLDFVDHAAHFRENAMHRDLDGPWARRVAEHTGTTLHPVVIEPEELLACSLEPMRAFDRPSAGEIDTSLLLLFRRMKPQATVVLSGESADEMFGGYPWFYVDQLLSQDTFPWAQMSGRYIVLSPEVRAALRLPELLRARYREAMDEVPRLPGESAREARSREMFYMNITRFLPLLLDRKDRLSMASSVEVRVPFCDHVLVEYVWNVPWSMKYVDQIEKGLLRRALSHVLPEDVLRRRKTAYPVAYHPRYQEGLHAEVRRILDDSSSPVRSFLSRQDVEQVLAGRHNDAPPGMFGGTGILEFVVQLHHWMKEYKVSIRT